MNKVIPEVLRLLFDEFLETLDDEDLFECYDSEKNNANSVLNEFMEWLKVEQMKKDVMV